MTVLQLVPALVVTLYFIERVRETRIRREVVAGEKKEALTLQIFMTCGALVSLGGAAEYLLRGAHPWWPGVVVGTVLLLTSLVVRRSAIAALGRFWSLHVEMRQGHEFVRSGPFRWVRHPVYTSMILEHAGASLITGAWVTLGIVLALFIPNLVRRLRLEEHALVEKFGAAYEQYRRSTPALIPYRPPLT